MVTQETYLFHGTIYDNIAYARPGATEAEIAPAARDANIHDRIMSFDEGYDTDHRRARLPALRRGEAAAGDRPGAS